MSRNFILTGIRLFGILLIFPPILSAQSNYDPEPFTPMVQWTSHEIIQALSFGAANRLYSPVELNPGALQPEFSIGAGVLHFDRSKFSAGDSNFLGYDWMNRATIAPEYNVQYNFAAGMRIGLPNRWDIAINGADMQVPQTYSQDSRSAASGRSDTVGFGIRKYFFGGGSPGLSLGANWSYSHGSFFLSRKNYGEPWVADINTNWNVSALSFSAIASQRFSDWIPFLGIAVNKLGGSASSSLSGQTLNVTGDYISDRETASSIPERYQQHLIFGAQWNYLVLSGDMKISGESAGKMFTLTSGIAIPFRTGISYDKADADTPIAVNSTQKAQRRSTRKEVTEEEYLIH